MNPIHAIAGAMTAVTLIVASAVFATEPTAKHDMGAMKHSKETMMHDAAAFMKACDMDHDGMVSRAEMRSHMDRIFDRMDTKKSGKLDSKQTEDFLREFTKQSGG
jgi:hypothetical protein